MFSGLVEEMSQITSVQPEEGLIRIQIQRPAEFKDIKRGDSIAVDGVCLTLENFDDSHMGFAIAAETLHITNWTTENLAGRRVNLERSLKFGDRIHGHLVTGHVDGLGRVTAIQAEGASLWLMVSLPAKYRFYIWPKGSIALNGVSLTINTIKDGSLSVCLIPETQKLTNLSGLNLGDSVHFEIDNNARGLVRWLESRNEEAST